VRPEGLSKLKKKNHLIGYGAHGLPVCSIALTTTLPRATFLLPFSFISSSYFASSCSPAIPSPLLSSPFLRPFFLFLVSFSSPCSFPSLHSLLVFLLCPHMQHYAATVCKAPCSCSSRVVTCSIMLPQCARLPARVPPVPSHAALCCHSVQGSLLVFLLCRHMQHYAATVCKAPCSCSSCVVTCSIMLPQCARLPARLLSLWGASCCVIYVYYMNI
jgi:hypothetical protein